jgi:plastocyanin domain-containing protein
MNAELLGIVALGLFAIAVIVLLFAPWRRRKVQAEIGADGCQVARIEVNSQAFDPEIIVVAAGRPVRLTFHRGPEAPDCTGRLHLIAFGKKLRLDPESTASIEVLPERPGEYAFACARLKLKGRIIAT